MANDFQDFPIRDIRQELAAKVAEVFESGIPVGITRHEKQVAAIVTHQTAVAAHRLSEIRSLSQLGALLQQDPACLMPLIRSELGRALATAAQRRQSRVLALETMATYLPSERKGFITAVEFASPGLIRLGCINLLTRGEDSFLDGWLEPENPEAELAIELPNGTVIDNFKCDDTILSFRQIAVPKDLNLAGIKIIDHNPINLTGA